MLISSNIKFTTTTTNVNDTTTATSSAATAADAANTPAGTTRTTTTTTKLKIRKQKKYKNNSSSNNNKKLFPQTQPTHHHNLRQHQFHQPNFYDELQIQSDDENDFLNLVPNSNPVKFLFEKFTTNSNTNSANCNKIFLLKLCFLKNQFKKLKSSLETISSTCSSSSSSPPPTSSSSSTTSTTTSSIEIQKLNDDYKTGIKIADHIITLLNFHIDYFINQEQQEDAATVDVNHGNIRFRKRKIG